MKIYFLSSLLLIASVLCSTAQTESKKFALIVGNANYPAVLPNATNDADDLALVLRQLSFKVILRKNLAKKDFEELIYLLKDSLASYDVGLFFFAGHGLEVGGVNYLIPIDTREKLAEEDVAYQCIPTDWIQQKMTNSGTKTNIVILDACRNNPFRSWRTLSDRAWARSQSANLSGMITCYAASQGQKASDGTGRNGSYTAALLKYIKTPDLNIYQLFEKVRKDLARNGSQLPIEENALMESFSFNPSSSFPSHLVNASDSDADGIPDSEDNCPSRYGTKANKGCPQEASGTDDYDRDGISDSVDPCPTEYGTTNGCPDEDRDGVPDKSDRCKSLDGKPEWEGCPDTDSDGIPDHLDQCPQEFGSKSYNGCAPSKTTPIVSSMVSIPASSNTYKMGNVFKDPDDNDENITSVNLSPFFMDKHETTFAEYDKFCDATGKEKPDDQGWGRGKRPVINVSWYDAIEYANWRSEQEGKTPCYTIDKYNKDPNNKNEIDFLKWKVSCNWQANGYRLPTQAEWEYAASWDPIKQKKSRFGNGKDIANSTEMNFDTRFSYKENYSNAGEYRDKTLEVGSFQSNAMGLFDMAGNVWEWCWDWYDAKNPKGLDPKGSQSGTYRNRVLRGGSWYNDPRRCRVAYRINDCPGRSNSLCGFRLVSSGLGN